MRRALFLVTSARRFAALALAAALPGAASSGCATRARMCNVPGECGAHAACVAGRCQPEAGVPVIQGTRRILLAPVDMAYVRSQGGDRGDRNVPAVAALGRAGDGDAVLLLRFAVQLPPGASVVEAYLLLDRADDVDMDPAPVTLHAARIVSPWAGREVTWGRQPRVEEVRAPATTVAPSRLHVRLDVRELVRRFQSRDPVDAGIAVVADTTSATGVPLALLPQSAPPEREPSLAIAAAAPPPLFASPEPNVAPFDAMRSAPRLELYVK